MVHHYQVALPLAQTQAPIPIGVTKKGGRKELRQLEELKRCTGEIQKHLAINPSCAAYYAAAEIDYPARDYRDDEVSLNDNVSRVLYNDDDDDDSECVVGNKSELKQLELQFNLGLGTKLKNPQYLKQRLNI